MRSFRFYNFDLGSQTKLAFLKFTPDKLTKMCVGYGDETK